MRWLRDAASVPSRSGGLALLPVLRRFGRLRRAPGDPLIGRTIADAYVILELTGVGGMGRVYRAEQTALGRPVAIKVIHQHMLSTQEFVARFYNGARAASRLNHPNSVSVIDFGRTDDGLVYLVMEYLRGQSLSQITAREGLLPLPRVCRIMVDVLAALDEAHAHGVVHRDLKPEPRKAWSAGYLVLLAGPHDSGARLPYFAIRSLLAQLEQAAPRESLAPADDPLAAAGLAELDTPRGLPGAPYARAGAVAYAFASALRRVLAQGGTERRALVAVDDLDRCDEPSARVLCELGPQLAGLRVLVIAVSGQPSAALRGRGAESLSLEGFGPDDARALLGERSGEAAIDGAARLLPLYLEQLRWLGLALSDPRPARLDEVVMLRIGRLSAACALRAGIAEDVGRIEQALAGYEAAITHARTAGDLSLAADLERARARCAGESRGPRNSLRGGP